jgi:hypothetical protein
MILFVGLKCSLKVSKFWARVSFWKISLFCLFSYFTESDLVQRLPLTGKIKRVSVAERELVKYFSRTVTITRVNRTERELVQHSSLTDTITRVNLAARFIPMGGEGRTISILSTVSCSHKFWHQGCTLFFKSKSRFKILGVRWLTCSKFGNGDAQILDRTTKSVVASTNWRLGFVHPRSTQLCYYHLMFLIGEL